MSRRVEQGIMRLEDEAKALKEAFQRNSTTMDVYTAQKNDNNPPANRYTGSNCKVLPNYNLEYMSGLKITLNTPNGVNAIAKIVPYARRIPFEGGAQWIYLGSPEKEVDFTIYTSTPGIVTVEEI